MPIRGAAKRFTVSHRAESSTTFTPDHVEFHQVPTEIVREPNGLHKNKKT